MEGIHDSRTPSWRPVAGAPEREWQALMGRCEGTGEDERDDPRGRSKLRLTASVQGEPRPGDERIQNRQQIRAPITHDEHRFLSLAGDEVVEIDECHFGTVGRITCPSRS